MRELCVPSLVLLLRVGALTGDAPGAVTLGVAPGSKTGDSTGATGARSVAKGVRPVATGNRPVATGNKPVATGVRPVAKGVRPVATGVRPVATGVRSAVNGGREGTKGVRTGAPIGASTGVICPWIHGTRNDERVRGRKKDNFIFDGSDTTKNVSGRWNKGWYVLRECMIC
jgi:hypothetical protein